MIDVDAALAFLAQGVPEGPWPDGAPPAELRRSPAAARVGRLAADAAFFQLHYEHRVQEPGVPAEWVDGVLPEPKYEAFRHDLPIGSFHPGHRPKWTAHELCHSLVGFAWRPGAPPVFHATAGRLAELVPVVLWYFLDEIGLRRCPRHRGPSFRAPCAACSEAASAGAVPIDEGRARTLLVDAARFVEDELAAVARTLRLGRPCPHVWGSIDLCSDGLAYAAAHAPRLGSRAFGAFADRFLRPGDLSWSASLEDLEERVHAVLRAIVEGRALAVPAGGPSRWVAWDLSQRLLEIWEETDGDCASALLDVVDGLASGGPARPAFDAYAALFDAYELPRPDEVFAVGYPLDGVPARSVAQVEEGLGTVVPLVLELAHDAGVDLVEPFVAADGFERRPLGDRFAGWLAVHHPDVAALAGFEAALRHAGSEPEAAILGPGDCVRFADGVRVLVAGHDPAALADAVEAGTASGALVEGRLVASPPPPDRATRLAVVRAGSEPVVAVLPDGDPEGWPADLRASLLGAGVLAPRAWAGG